MWPPLYVSETRNALVSPFKVFIAIALNMTVNTLSLSQLISSK